jgi:restriction system protein
MFRDRRNILPWIYVLLAAVGYLLATWGYESAVSWSREAASAESEFSRAFSVNFLAVLRVALPVFFALLAIFSVFTRVRPRRRPRPTPVAGAAGREKSGGTHGSEVVDLTFGLVRRMEWRRFEMVCAQYLRCLNYEVLETGFGAKDAVDLEIFLPGKSELLSVVKCIGEARQAGISDVRELVASMKRRRVPEGMIFCAIGGSKRATKLARRYRIVLVDGEALCARVRTLDREHREAMIRVATAGDYSTPTCPSCGIKMVLRRRARARPGRGEFWGCINYPRCRRTIPFA